jgi:hypothetical protein
MIWAKRHLCGREDYTTYQKRLANLHFMALSLQCVMVAKRTSRAGWKIYIGLPNEFFMSLPARAPLRDSAEPVGAFHNSDTLNLAKRRLWAALGISLVCTAFCCATSIARIRAAATASIPRLNRALARRTNLGAAKSCFLVIIFMIHPPTAKVSQRLK